MNRERALQILEDIGREAFEMASEHERNELDEMRAYIEKNLQ